MVYLEILLVIEPYKDIVYMTMNKDRYQTYQELSKRLDQIVLEVKEKDTSLEKSLDLFDEAIELGAQAVELVDSEALGEIESPSA